MFPCMRCGEEYYEIQQQHKGSYYCGYRCQRCGHVMIDLGAVPRSEPFDNIPIVTNVDLEYMDQVAEASKKTTKILLDLMPCSSRLQ